MAEPTLQQDARRAQSACARFEADLSAYADGERTELDGQEIATHVESCEACRSYVTALAGLSRLHLFGAVDGGSELPSGTELWGDLTRRLLEDNCAKLAGVLYELGKALVAAGLRTSTELRGVPFFARKPGPIRQLSHKGQALFREHRDLAARARRADGETLSNPRGSFPQSERVEAAEAFEAGRACLEQCLRLDPTRHEARIYLAKYFSVNGRFDRARQLLRTVLHSKGRDGAAGDDGVRGNHEKLKFFALQQLARVYSMTHQFERAVELEREVLVQAERAQNDLFQAVVLTNLSINYVKLGRLDDAESAIDRLATRFATHLETVTVPIYRRARDFKQALLRHRSFLTRLRGRYPLLFAS
jgi:tetratricopeptide (TPR) repeat protein